MLRSGGLGRDAEVAADVIVNASTITAVAKLAQVGVTGVHGVEVLAAVGFGAVIGAVFCTTKKVSAHVHV